MTKLFSKILSLTLTLLTIASLCTGVWAGNVELTEKEIQFTDVDKTWTDSDLFNNFKGVMPGDTLTQEITVKVDSKDCDYANLTLTAIPHEESQNPLSEKVAEKETVASMQDFLNQLTMKVSLNGVETSFNGINGVLELGKIETGKSVTLEVELTVPIEMGNEYANRVAEVDWMFSASAVTNTKLTVLKVWKDNNYPKRPTSVTVNLIKTDSDGNKTTEDSQVLDQKGQWTYTWSELSDEYTWSVEETNVPDKYTVTYNTATEGLVKIINSYDYNPPYIPWYPTPDPKPDPKPDTPIEPEPSETEPVETEPEETQPDETNPPETEPDETEPPVETPVVRDLTVHKTWAEDKADERPTSVTVALYNAENEVEKVVLGDWNNWSYTWYDLNSNEQWSVLEVDIPLGYTPSYAADGDTITITNNAILIQTGQLNWPIFVFGGLGVLLVGGGVVLMCKKKHEDA